MAEAKSDVTKPDTGKVTKPEALESEADCRRLAEWEWENVLDPRTRPVREQHLTVRTAQLVAGHAATFTKPQATV